MPHGLARALGSSRERAVVGLWCILLAACVAGCSQSSSGDAAKDTSAQPDKAAPVPVEAKATGGEATAKGGEQGKAAAADDSENPVRESLTLLARNGGAAVKSLRQERQNIYRLFGQLTPEQQKDVAGPVAMAQRLQWDEDPAKLAGAPAQIHAAVMALLPLSAKYVDSATEKLKQYGEMQKEVGAGKKHSERQMDKIQVEGSAEMKVGRNLALLVRSLLDEARIYAQHGSTKMRKEMIELYGPLKDRPMAIEQVTLALQWLLFDLGMEGVTRPE
jgi:hypothetical protein